MLILSRRIGETLVICNEVFVTVLGIKGNQVRLGCEAPPTISIHRQEIHDRIQKKQLIREDESSTFAFSKYDNKLL